MMNAPRRYALAAALWVTTGCVCGDPEFAEREKRATRELGLLSGSARAFAARTGRLPTAVEEMICDAGCELTGRIVDPWNNAYREFHIGNSIHFESAGRDGRWKTSDDIHSLPIAIRVLEPGANGGCDARCSPPNCIWVGELSHCYQRCTADWECATNELCLCAVPERCLVPTRVEESGFAPRTDVCVRPPSSMLDHRRMPPDGGAKP